MRSMRYWGTEVTSKHRFILAPASDSVVVCFCIEPHPYKSGFSDALVMMGGVYKWGFESIEKMITHFLGEYSGHLEVGLDQYEQLHSGQTSWVWMLDEVVSTLIPIMRAQWLANRDIADHINEFYSTLGFNEFYASKHKYFEEHGHLPPLVEGFASTRRR